MQQRQIDLEAAEWLVRLDDVGQSADPAEQQDWIAWLQRSPRHVQAYFDIANLSQSVDEVAPDGRRRIRELLAAHRLEKASLDGMRFLREDNGTRFGNRKWLAAAAAAICVITGATWFTVAHPDYEVGVGQQKAYTLPDGSSMVLNTRSRAQISMNDRERVVQLDGEALFTVAREAGRPFLVRTHSAVTRAVGTQFNVYSHADDGTRVSVIDGAVQVSAASPAPHANLVLLSAGQEAEVRGSSVAKRPASNVQTAIAWRKKVLMFEDAPLREVAAQFNRYNVVQFSIAPQVSGELRLSGTFDPLHPEHFRKYLERDESLNVRVQGNEIRVTARADTQDAATGQVR